MKNLLKKILCVFYGHKVYSYRLDGSSPFRRSPVDDWIEIECLRCGETLRAPYGLAIPNIKLGSPK